MKKTNNTGVSKKNKFEDSYGVFSANEKQANLLAARMLMGISLFTAMLVAGMAGNGFSHTGALLFCAVIGVFVRLILYAVIIHTDGERHYYKWILFGYLLAYATLVSFVVNSTMWLLFFLPVLLITRYYDRKQVIIAGSVSGAMAILQSVVGIYVGVKIGKPFMPVLAFNTRSEIILKVTGNTIDDVANAVRENIDSVNLPAMYRGMFPISASQFLVFAALVIGCAVMAGHGRKTIEKQIENAKKSAEFQRNIDRLHEAEKEKEILEVIRSLSARYEYVAYIDLMAESVKQYIVGDKLKEYVEGELGETLPQKKFTEFLQRIMKASDFEKIAEIVKNGNLFRLEEGQGREPHDFIVNLNGKEEYYRMRIAKDSNFENAVICGIYSVDELKRQEMKNWELYHVISEMTSDYDIIYFVDFDSGEQEFFRVKDSVGYGIDDNPIAETYNQRVNEFAERFIAVEDRENYVASMTDEYIMENTGKGRGLTIRYRLKTEKGILWYETRASRYSDKEDRRGALFGVRNVDREVHEEARIREEHQNRELQAVVRSLTEDFAFVSYVDTETKRETICQDANFSKLFSLEEKEECDYGERVRMVAERCVHPEDREQFLAETSWDAVMKNLAEKNAYFVNFRVAFPEHEEFWQAKFVLTDSVPARLVLGFHSIDEEIRKERAEVERQKNDLQLISKLSESFLSVYYVDLETDQYLNYRKGQSFAENAENMSYSETIQKYLKESVFEKDAPAFAEAIKPETIKEKLRYSRFINLIYRDISSGSARYFEMQMIRVGDEGEVRFVIITFADYDDTYHANLENTRYSEIANMLSERFENLYYVNLSDNSYSVYHSQKKDHRMESAMEGTDFFADMEERVQNAVYKDDREEMLSFLNKENLIAELSDHPSVSKEFRELTNDGPCYYKIHCFYFEEEENYVILALENVNGEVYAQKEQMNRLMMLSDEFEAIYDVDLDTGKFDVSSKSGANVLAGTGELDSHEDFFNGPRDQLLLEVYEEDRAGMTENTTREMILSHLSHSSIYKLDFRVAINGNLMWYRMRVARNRNWPEEHKVLIGLYNNNESYTKEMAYRRELEHSKKLAEAANEAKTSFLNNMSHDIRTPMNAIVGYTGRAKLHMDDPDKLNEYLSKISASSDHLLKLINNVLNMSQIEAGKLVRNDKWEDVTTVLDSVVAMVSAQVEEKKQAIVRRYTLRSNELVLVDALRLSEIIMNIVSNAVKYTPKGGTITISAEEKDMMTPNFAFFSFVVEDNGIGMTEEFLEHIFDPFTRMQTSTVSGIQGSGLGMAITKEYVDQLGGKIKVESKEGVGTKVTLTFSLERKIQEESRIEDTQSNGDKKAVSLKGKKILVVEDVEMNRDLIEEILLDEGCIVESVGDGVDAVERMQRATPGEIDLILMDIQMPIMNGYEATRKIRALPNPEIAEIPIIAMTANAYEEDRKMAFEAGMSEHISKPLNVPLLIKAIENFTEK